MHLWVTLHIYKTHKYAKKAPSFIYYKAFLKVYFVYMEEKVVYMIFQILQSISYHGVKHPPFSWKRKTIITRQVLGRPLCDRGVIPRTLVQSNVVRSRLIILINEEINKANWMVSNSAKLDRRTKQHTQFGVSASNGSRDMARTKSWWKKRKNKNK